MLHLRPPQSLHTAPPHGGHILEPSFHLKPAAIHDRTQSLQSRTSTSLLQGFRQLPAIGELCTSTSAEDYPVTSTMDGQVYATGSGGQYATYGQGHTAHDHSQFPASARYQNGYGNATTAHHALQQVHFVPNSRPSSRPESPVFQSDDVPTPSRRGSQQGGIVSYLQIPSTVSSSKGSLAEFAAQVGQNENLPHLHFLTD